MAIFELKCPHCDFQKEVVCKYEELQLLEISLCRTCCQLMERVISVPAPAQFKGSGWARDGYANKPKP
jgi:predicted nucleic acid-binding Zn ribbon protein